MKWRNKTFAFLLMTPKVITIRNLVCMTLGTSVRLLYNPLSYLWLTFGSWWNFFSHSWKHNVFHLLGVLASVGSALYRSNDSLLSLFRHQLICSYHIRLILNMSSFKNSSDGAHIEVLYNCSEWRSGIVINHFRDHWNKVMSSDSIRTLSILFTLNCCY